GMESRRPCAFISSTEIFGMNVAFVEVFGLAVYSPFSSLTKIIALQPNCSATRKQPASVRYGGISTSGARRVQRAYGGIPLKTTAWTSARHSGTAEIPAALTAGTP